MFEFDTYLTGLAITLSIALATWIVSLVKRDVSIVDSVWAIFILAAGLTFVAVLPEHGPRTSWILLMVTTWAFRLSGYLTWRNWGQPEDRRYQAIRQRNQPHFAVKSLWLVFILQAVMAWLVSLPLLAALSSQTPMGWLDFLGIAIWTLGFAHESLADWQLARFKADPDHHGKVMNQGLWRYSRHPNYFGECLVWWGFFTLALAAGGWWSVISPLFMTFLLLKVSGVSLLEQDIEERRPEYRNYILSTNAFLPGPPRTGQQPNTKRNSEVAS